MISDNYKFFSIAFAAVSAIALIYFTAGLKGQITGFFAIGDALPLSPFLRAEETYIHHGEAGYDGQLFLTLAFDPMLSNKDTLNSIDNPKYRYKRIGYPLLGYLLGLGRTGLIPYALVLINIICAAALVPLLYMLRSHNFGNQAVHAALPFLALLIPGLWVTLLLSTADLLALTLFVVGLVSLKHEKFKSACCALCSCLLVRDTYLLSVIAVAMVTVRFKNVRASGAVISALIVPSLWWGWTTYTISTGTSGSSENLGVPFVGIARTVVALIRRPPSLAMAFEAYCFLLLLLVAIAAAMAIIAGKHIDILLRAALLPHVLLLVVSKHQILDYHAGYLRVFMILFMVPLLMAYDRRPTWSGVVISLFYGGATFAYVANMILS